MSGSVGYRIPGAKLRYGIAIRGWQKQDLARLAGVSKGVVTKACAGEPVRMSSIERISQALTSHPPKPELVELLREGDAA